MNQLRKEQPDAAFYVRRRISNAEKIEEQMLDAIRKEKDFSLRNTRVEVIDFPGLSKRVNVYLYSKCICKLTEDELEVNTTGSRRSPLNPESTLSCEFNGCTEIIQVQGKWYWQTLIKSLV